MENVELFSPAEVGVAAGVPLKSMYKIIEERLPRDLVVRRKKQRFLTLLAALCVWIDREMPREVPVALRKRFYAEVKSAKPALTIKRGVLSYVVDVKSAEEKMKAGLAKQRKVRNLIVEDPDIQSGAATFKGTRILVHQIADLVARGVPESELREHYPRLSGEMIAAAKVYSKTHPRRGRPRKPSWRNAEPLSERTLVRRGA
jgi:uncharacterized protein (DUF433 family)